MIPFLSSRPDALGVIAAPPPAASGFLSTTPLAFFGGGVVVSFRLSLGCLNAGDLNAGDRVEEALAAGTLRIVDPCGAPLYLVGPLLSSWLVRGGRLLAESRSLQSDWKSFRRCRNFSLTMHEDLWIGTAAGGYLEAVAVVLEGLGLAGRFPVLDAVPRPGFFGSVFPGDTIGRGDRPEGVAVDEASFLLESACFAGFSVPLGVARAARFAFTVVKFSTSSAASASSIAFGKVGLRSAGSSRGSVGVAAAWRAEGAGGRGGTDRGGGDVRCRFVGRTSGGVGACTEFCELLLLLDVLTVSGECPAALLLKKTKQKKEDYSQP